MGSSFLPLPVTNGENELPVFEVVPLDVLSEIVDEVPPAFEEVVDLVDVVVLDEVVISH